MANVATAVSEPIIAPSNPASITPAIIKWATTLIAAYLMRKITSLDAATAGEVAQLVIGALLGLVSLGWTIAHRLKVGRAQVALAEHAPTENPATVDAVAKSA